MWDYRACCLRIHDGDTLTLLIDQGLHSRQQEQIRLAGVSAPELGQPGGIETRDFAQHWIDMWSMPMLTWPLLVVTEKNTSTEPEERRTFTRYIGWIWDVNKKSSLNTDINSLLAGHPEWGHGVV